MSGQADLFNFSGLQGGLAGRQFPTQNVGFGRSQNSGLIQTQIVGFQGFYLEPGCDEDQNQATGQNDFNPEDYLHLLSRRAANLWLPVAWAG